MVTFGTDHQSMNDFVEAIDLSAPGASICYAFGDLAVSAPYSAELNGLRSLAYRISAEGRGRLTQRRRTDMRFHRGGACYEYLFTKTRAAQDG